MAASTRDDLLRAAWTVLRDEGPAAATSRRITEVAGANLQAITYHFGSKDALVGEAVVARLRDWTAPLTEALAGEDDGIEAHDARVAAAVAGMLGRLAADPADVTAVVTVVLTSPSLPGVQEAAAGWLGELRRVATDAMARQQALGAVPATVDPPALSGVFTAFALGLVAQSALDPAAPTIGEIVGEFLKLLVRPTTDG